MRERLLAAFLSLTLLTVLLYGVPRAFVRADIVTSEAQRDVTRTAEVLAVVVGTRLEAGLSYDEAVDRLAPADDSAVLRRGGDVDVLTGPTISDVPPDSLVGRADVEGGGTVEVRRPQAVVRQDVVRALRPIVLSGLLALGLAALAGIVLAGRLSRPFARLAEQASALGAGDFSVDVPTQRVREAELIAAALRDSGERLTEMLAREREFARNASHQLRTPLTGMRLRVEDVSLWPETPPAVREELEQVLTEVDRLSDTVTSLLAFARQGRMGAWEPTWLDALVATTLDRWRPLAAGLDRELSAGPVDEAQVALPRIALEQVLDVLVDNALKHGKGTVSVDASADATAVRFLVADEGELPAGSGGQALLTRSAASTADGEGIGLGLSGDLIASLGGRLRLLHTRPTTFELLLPTTPQP